MPGQQTVRLNPLPRLLLLVALFATGFGVVEGSVVIYLRGLYYPDGFRFPLLPLDTWHFQVELAREAATILMLAAFAAVSVRGRWERFAVFMVAFGVWDIVYYLWLALALGWPAGLFEWDILFLIPLPWIGPVAAPALIALLMVGAGILILARLEGGWRFVPGRAGWGLGLAAAVLILWTFMSDTTATLEGALPAPYRYDLFLAGCAGLVIALFRSFQRPVRNDRAAP